MAQGIHPASREVMFFESIAFRVPDTTSAMIQRHGHLLLGRSVNSGGLVL